MTLFAFKNFWRDVIRCSTDCSLPLSVELKFGSQTEITNLDLHLVVEEQVAELQISVDDTVTVQVLHDRAELVHVALDLKFVKSLPSSQKLVQLLVLTQLEKNIDVLCILEEVFEADDVVVVERSMDLDL